MPWDAVRLTPAQLAALDWADLFILSIETGKTMGELESAGDAAMPMTADTVERLAERLRRLTGGQG